MKTAIKALVVTPYYHPKIGGLENYARQLGIVLQQERNWEIIVATSNHTGRADIVDSADGMKVYRLGRWFKFSNTPVNPLWAFKLRRIIAQEKPDIILAHTPVPTMADAAALAAGKTPLVLFYHAATLKKGGSPIFNLVARVYQIYESLTLSRATRIAAVSDYVKTALPKRFQNKTIVVPNAVWQSAVTERRQREGKPHFVFIGSLDKTHAWKGLDRVIDAIAIYNETSGDTAKLTVVGDGNYRASYEAQAKALGASAQIHFAGALTGVAKDAQLATATALICYPTTGNDAFPTVMLEAWALGVPVIAGAIGPIPSLINDGQDGILVSPNDATALAEALQNVAGMPSEDRQQMAATAADRVRANYTWERQAEAVQTLAGDLL
jgi:glycosyltransferase involved in cell wall biosynthesis